MFLTEETAKDRINAQMSQEIKEKKADYVIDNSFESKSTISQVAKLLSKLNQEPAWNFNRFKPGK